LINLYFYYLTENKLKKTSDENQNNIKNKVYASNQKKVSKSQDVYQVSTDAEDYLQAVQKK